MKIAENGTFAPQNYGKLVIVEGTYLAATLSTLSADQALISGKTGSKVKMPKAPRDKENTTPKKRTRKAATAAGNGVHPENGSAFEVAQQAVTSPEIASEVVASPAVEEKIRVRAYELYLQRGSNGGSPEQDWLRAVEEICGQQRSA